LQRQPGLGERVDGRVRAKNFLQQSGTGAGLGDHKNEAPAEGRPFWHSGIIDCGSSRAWLNTRLEPRIFQPEEFGE
jgi:hypothetical protein